MKTVIIGLTGTSGSGKTTFATEAEKYGFSVINADNIAKQCQQKGSPLLKKIEEAFGGTVINGELDRKKLAKIAFSTPENTKKLNLTTLPFIKEKIEQEIKNLKNSGKNLILLDAPTLFEAQSDTLCTKIVGVVASEEARIKRILERDNLTKDQALARINAQKSEEFFKANCNIIIENNGTFAEFLQKTEAVLKELKNG